MGFQRRMAKKMSSKSSTPPAVEGGRQWLYIALSVLLAVVPYQVFFADGDGSLEDIGVSLDLLWPVNMNHQMAFSDVRHNNSINRILHLFTNPLIYFTQTCLMDMTSALISLPDEKLLKLNFAGFYLIFYSIYWIAINPYLGFFGCLWLIVFYWVGTGPYQRFIFKRYPKNWARITFALYIFGQGIQIVYGHEYLENYYDWNLFHLFMLQQYVNCIGVIKSLGLTPTLKAALESLKPIYADCIVKNINAIECEKIATAMFPDL